MFDPSLQGEQVDEGTPDGEAREEESHLENESTEEPQADGTGTRRFNPKSWEHQRSHPLELIISDIEKELRQDPNLKTYVHSKPFCHGPQDHNDALL